MNLFDYIDKKGLLIALLEDQIREWIKQEGYEGEYDMDDIVVTNDARIAIQAYNYVEVGQGRIIVTMVNLYNDLIREKKQC